MGEEKRIFGYARTVTSDQLNGQLLIKEDEAVVVTPRLPQKLWP